MKIPPTLLKHGVLTVALIFVLAACKDEKVNLLDVRPTIGKGEPEVSYEDNGSLIPRVITLIKYKDPETGLETDDFERCRIS